MCVKKNENPENDSDGSDKQSEVMISDLLSAISETEYPQYILEALEIIRDWLNKAINKEESETSDIFSEFLSNLEDDEASIESLFEKLNTLEEFANIVPNPEKNDRKPDTIIINVATSEYDSGLRAAIDYAAVFNRPDCKRVWIISDTFIFDEIVKYIPHVDALTDQGINLRFILVTAWGWVEIPLSESQSSKNQFLWKSKEHEVKRRKRKQ